MLHFISITRGNEANLTQLAMRVGLFKDDVIMIELVGKTAYDVGTCRDFGAIPEPAWLTHVQGP